MRVLLFIIFILVSLFACVNDRESIYESTDLYMLDGRLIFLHRGAELSSDEFDKKFPQYADKNRTIFRTGVSCGDFVILGREMSDLIEKKKTEFILKIDGVKKVLDMNGLNIMQIRKVEVLDIVEYYCIGDRASDAASFYESTDLYMLDGRLIFLHRGAELSSDKFDKKFPKYADKNKSVFRTVPNCGDFIMLGREIDDLIEKKKTEFILKIDGIKKVLDMKKLDLEEIRKIVVIDSQ